MLELELQIRTQNSVGVGVSSRAGEPRVERGSERGSGQRYLEKQPYCRLESEIEAPSIRDLVLVGPRFPVEVHTSKLQ